VADFVRQTYPNAKKHIFATSFGGYISLLCYDFLMDFNYILRAPAITMPDLLLQNVLKVSEQEFKACGFIDCGFERPILLPYSFYAELRLQDDLLCKQYMKSVHIFHGDRDDIVPLDVILSFVNNNQNANLILVKGADHRFKNEGEIETIIAATKLFLQ
jgi:alpha/beta superfamily hydrolase